MPAIFIIVYVERYSLSSQSIAPHFRLVLAAWLFISVNRALISKLIQRETVSKLVSAVIASAALLLVLSYYSAVLIGLESWGQVISADLIRSYSVQAPALSEALGVSPALVGIGVGILYLLLFIGAKKYINRFDWSSLLARGTSNWMFALLVAASMLIIAAECVSFSVSQAGRVDEPITLTAFPSQSASLFQDHYIDRLSAERLDASEDLARAAYVATPQAEPTNLVLIVVDALRPDHLGVYGYPRGTTPTLDQLKRTGVMRVVSGVRASCAESACGLLSLASSKYVHQFSARLITLHEILRRHEYRVHMILGGDHTNFYGLKEAYGKVDSYFDGADADDYYANDDQFVVDRAAVLPDWNGAPVMLQFHLMSAHVLGKRHSTSLKFSPSLNYAVPRNGRDARRDEFLNYYDNGVVQADQIIGELLTTLERKGYLRRTVVVITADHGESLGEHALYAHANSVRESGLKIPLMFISYGYSPAQFAVRGSASQVDVAPTILDELGIARPTSWTGMSLLQSGNESFSYFQQKQEAGLIDRRDAVQLWKYWINHHNGEEYAFDLTRDPDEFSNVIDRIPRERKQEWLSLLLKLRPVGNRSHPEF